MKGNTAHSKIQWLGHKSNFCTLHIKRQILWYPVDLLENIIMVHPKGNYLACSAIVLWCNTHYEALAQYHRLCRYSGRDLCNKCYRMKYKMKGFINKHRYNWWHRWLRTLGATFDVTLNMGDHVTALSK
jgi:hypothetical protein